MVEAEISFYHLEQIIEFIEEMIKYIVKGVLHSNYKELLFFEKSKEEGIVSRLQSLLNRKFEIVSYTECIEILGRKVDENPYFFSSKEVL